MKKMYFLKDRKEAVIDRLTYMSKHRQEYLQDKEHGMITLQFKQGMPVIRFSSGRVTSYWDFSFDGKKMTVQRRCSLSDKIIWGTLLIIDLFILYSSQSLVAFAQVQHHTVTPAFFSVVLYLHSLSERMLQL